MRIRNHRDFWSGIMFLAMGVLFTIFSQAYQLGTPARMGPGFFPTMLGVLMALLGVAIAWRATARSSGKGDLESVGWRELFLVLVAVGVFAAALPYLGMVVSVTERHHTNPQVVQNVERARMGSIPAWLELSPDKPEGKIVSLPSRAEIDTQVTEQLIVEFYST